MEVKKVYELARYRAEISRQDLERYNRTARGPRVRLETLTADQVYDLAAGGVVRGDINRETVARFVTAEAARESLSARTAIVWRDCYHRAAIVETFGVGLFEVDEDGDEVWCGDEWACENLDNEYAQDDEDEDEE